MIQLIFSNLIIYFDQVNDLQIEDTSDGELIDGENDGKKIELAKRDKEIVNTYLKKSSSNSSSIKSQLSDDSNLQLKNILAPQSAFLTQNSSINDSIKKEDVIVEEVLAETVNEMKKYASIRSIDIETAKQLRLLLFGNLNTTFSTEWTQQSFKYSDIAKLKYGLLKQSNSGGPCVVLAVVQAFIIQEILFTRSDYNLKSISDYNFL